MNAAVGPRALRALTLSAVVAHVAARLWFAYSGRFFASEDDAYRTYLAFLITQGGNLIGHFWLPGHLVAMALAQLLGVPVAWSGIAVGSLATIGLAAAVADVTRQLAPQELSAQAPWAAVFLLAASPFTLVLGHSSLAELLECALVMGSASAVLRRLHGGSRTMLFAGILALLVATWVRYEAWAVCLALPGVFLLMRRRLDAVVATVPMLGPLAWIGCQYAAYGNPFGFVTHIDGISTGLVGEPSSLQVLTHRSMALLTWAPATLVWSLLGAYWLRRCRPALFGALILAGSLSVGMIIEIARGNEHPVFVARLAFGLEVSLWPLAALGVAILFTRPWSRKVAGVALTAAFATVAVLSLGVIRPPELIDRSSVTAGLSLRRGNLAAMLGGGLLLIERVPERPPFGWAAVGVLWSDWSRIVWATRRVNRWEIVQPTQVRIKTEVGFDDLGGWLTQHDVTAAWILTPGSLELVQNAWPTSRLLPIDKGVLVLKE